MSKNRSTGFLARSRRMAANERGGTNKQKYRRYLDARIADLNAIAMCGG